MAESGWYPDPEQTPDTERYWDGEKWGDTRATPEPLPRGWYPDPDFRPNIERFWDGEQWWSTRTAPDSLPPRPDPETQNSGDGFVVHILGKLVIAGLLAFAGLFSAEQRTAREPTWSEQACVQAVLLEVTALRSEVEDPTMTEWVPGTGRNHILLADERRRTRCDRDGRVPKGFDQTGVQADFAALRAHLQFDRPSPLIEDMTTLEEIEEWLD